MVQTINPFTVLQSVYHISRCFDYCQWFSAEDWYIS